MQKQPKYLKTYSPNELTEEFPFMTSALYYQTDREIIELHLHNVLEMGYCYEGSGVFIVEDKIMQYNAGDIIFITSNEYHLAQSAAGSISKWKWIYVDIDKLLMPFISNYELTDVSAFYGYVFKNVLSFSIYPELCSIVKNMIIENETKKAFYKDNIRSLLILFMTKMHRLFAREKQLPLPQKSNIQRLHKAILHISANFATHVEVNSLAKRCSMSPTNFRRLFKQTMGKSAQSYLNEIRITMACVQLKNKIIPITQIAFECGFTSLSSFNRQFKKIIGSSPRDYRKKQ